MLISIYKYTNPWSTIAEKLIVAQLVKSKHVLYGTQNFIIVSQQFNYIY